MALVLRAADAKEATVMVMTPLDLRTNGIVTLIGRDIELKAVATWEYMTVKVPEDPTPMDEVAKKAGPLRISFDVPGFEDVKGRKHFAAVGDAVKVVRGTDGREGYAIGNVPLANGREYVLKARIRLRSSFKAELLENPVFVKQCNNPQYWSQTFELEVLGVR